ncbi:hypothetical protein HYALB_00013567 [Hymenoscyphus albidus]|uniref:Uncharacterized protein n=2 Tax=Hymenoscyphus albidus TaxID=595503 RepID=A0A9N9QC37_9HELO|nr:hypothetical protein HYALB_00009106 [Hymenoscyphus albidus]CAG8981946.1 hypothetical protein HYALB_00013567 [Hymenoscyphus albidus]
MAYGLLLWRIFAARKWGERLSGLTGDQVTLPITDITYWKRNQLEESADFVRRSAIQTEDTLTIAIDNLGIRSLEVLDSWPSAISHQAKRHEVYVVEKISNFHNRLMLEKKGDYIRIQNMDEPLRLWDTPAPPSLHSCQFKDKETSPLRLGTIKLDTSLRGLSVFCCDRSTYGIYPHYTDDLSSVLDIFNQIPLRRRNTLIWLFCPLAQQQIRDVWLRHDSIPIFSTPALVVVYMPPFLECL